MGRYLPSAQFATIIGSLFLSAGVVYAAQYVTHRDAIPSNLGVTNTAISNGNWEATLNQIQAQNAESALKAPDPDTVNKFLVAAQSSNVTETIGKTIFVNLSSAKSQGLGDDIPTQDQIVAVAAAQVAGNKTKATSYGYSDLTITSVSNTTLHAYGNAVIQAFAAYPAASEKATLLAIDYAVEGKDKSQEAKLAAIGAAYKAAAVDLLAIPVPQTLAPFHLEVINNLLRTSATYADMQTIAYDSVRGLAGLQAYESFMDEGARVFTHIAQALNKEGILFNKDEPGNAWSVFLPSPQ